MLWRVRVALLTGGVVGIRARGSQGSSATKSIKQDRTVGILHVDKVDI